jgi:hypothetical protein
VGHYSDARTLHFLTILDHRDPTTTQEHYNRASSFSVGKHYRAVIDKYKS